MAVRTDVTVDWSVSPRIITVASPSTEITIQDLVDTCRSLEDDLYNMSFPHLIDAAGKEPLGGGTLVGITATLLDAKVKFEDRPGPTYVVCDISGGNLVAYDTVLDSFFNPVEPSAYVTVTKTSSSSATLQDLETIQAGVYAGQIAVDQADGVAGTAFPIGTHETPVNNWADALTIATERGLEVFVVHGACTLTTGDDVSGYALLGENAITTQLTVDAGANVANVQFEDMFISNSTMDGLAYYKHCSLQDVSGVEGFVENCLLRGTITLTGTQNTFFVDCKSGCVGLGSADLPKLDFNNEQHQVAIRNWSGPIKFQNSNNAATTACVDIVSGATTIFDSTVSAGTYTIRGSGRINDQSTGTATIEDHTTETNVWGREVNGVVVGSFGEIVRRTSFVEGSVYVDVNNGSAGTAYPLGTSANPVNNIADAVAIGNVEGIHHIKVAEDVTILATDNVDGYIIEGAHPSKSEITVQAGASTTFTQFVTCFLNGVTSGQIIVRDSLVEDLTMEGLLHQCMITGAVTLQGTRASHILDCFSGVPGTSTPELDCGGTGRGFALRNFNGGMKVVNKTGTESASIDMNSGQIIIDGTVTNGTIVVRGNAHLTDNSNASAVINTNGLINIPVEIIRKFETNRTLIDETAFTLTVFDDDGVTPLDVFDLKDSAGVASYTEIFERVPQ